MVARACNLLRLKLEDSCEFKANLCNTVRSCLYNKSNIFCYLKENMAKSMKELFPPVPRGDQFTFCLFPWYSAVCLGLVLLLLCFVVGLGVVFVLLLVVVG